MIQIPFSKPRPAAANPSAPGFPKAPVKGPSRAASTGMPDKFPEIQGKDTDFPLEMPEFGTPAYMFNQPDYPNLPDYPEVEYPDMPDYPELPDYPDLVQYTLPEYDPDGSILSRTQQLGGADRSRLNQAYSEAMTGTRSIENPYDREEALRSALDAYGQGLADIMTQATGDATQEYMDQYALQAEALANSTAIQNQQILGQHSQDIQQIIGQYESERDDLLGQYGADLSAALGQWEYEIESLLQEWESATNEEILNFERGY